MEFVMDSQFLPTFEIAGGSVAGRAHVAAGRNNQDAFYWGCGEGRAVAVVCDGCSGGAHSEVGAKLGARLMARALLGLLAEPRSMEEALECARDEVLRELRALAVGMSPGSGRGYSETIAQHFLFTIVGLALAHGAATLFALGDGLVWLNGEKSELGPFANNEPPYLGYGLLGDAREPQRTAFRILAQVPQTELESALIATDGVADLDAERARTVHGPLSRFWTEDAFFRNPDQVRRRLTVVNRCPEGGALSDDTTLVVVRARRPEQGA
jgi:hypothetical protein